jgi:hypothetical protein
LSHRSILRPTLEKLEALPPDQFQPGLTLIEQLVGSIKIDTKQQQQQ